MVFRDQDLGARCVFIATGVLLILGLLSGHSYINLSIYLSIIYIYMNFSIYICIKQSISLPVIYPYSIC